MWAPPADNANMQSATVNYQRQEVVTQCFADTALQDCTLQEICWHYLHAMAASSQPHSCHKTRTVSEYPLIGLAKCRTIVGTMYEYRWHAASYIQTKKEKSSVCRIHRQQMLSLHLRILLDAMQAMHCPSSTQSRQSTQREPHTSLTFWKYHMTSHLPYDKAATMLCKLWGS